MGSLTWKGRSLGLPITSPTSTRPMRSVALGRNEEAVYEWTSPSNAIPNCPRLTWDGAQCYVRLLIWDRALADLEQAAAWSYGDLGMQFRIMRTYATCLPERPDHAGRWILLLERMLRQGWDMVTRTSIPSGFFGAHIP